MRNSVRTLVHHVRKACVGGLTGMTSKTGPTRLLHEATIGLYDPLSPFRYASPFSVMLNTALSVNFFYPRVIIILEATHAHLGRCAHQVCYPYSLHHFVALFAF